MAVIPSGASALAACPQLSVAEMAEAPIPPPDQDSWVVTGSGRYLVAPFTDSEGRQRGAIYDAVDDRWTTMATKHAPRHRDPRRPDTFYGFTLHPLENAAIMTWRDADGSWSSVLDAATGRWSARVALPEVKGSASWFPSQGGVLVLDDDPAVAWRFALSANEWTRIALEGAPADPPRGRFYGVDGHVLFWRAGEVSLRLPLVGNRWESVPTDGEPTPSGGVPYPEVIAGQLVVQTHEPEGVAVYRPEDNAWHEVTSKALLGLEWHDVQTEADQVLFASMDPSGGLTRYASVDPRTLSTKGFSLDAGLTLRPRLALGRRHWVWRSGGQVTLVDPSTGSSCSQSLPALPGREVTASQPGWTVSREYGVVARVGDRLVLWGETAMACAPCVGGMRCGVCDPPVVSATSGLVLSIR